MGGYGSYGYGMGFLGIALMAVFWIAIVVGVVLLVRWLMAGGTHMGGMHMGMGGPMGPSAGTKSALDIAMERYAKGEITKEQFDQMKKDLGG
jgi:putative membrane protein